MASARSTPVGRAKHSIAIRGSLLNAMARRPVSETPILLDGFGMGESPRWHEDRLWFSNWGTNEIVAVDVEGNSEVIGAGGGGRGWTVDWLRDGRMLVTGTELVRVEPDGSRVRHADLRDISPYGWSELTVDGRGNAYVDSLNFDFTDFTEVLASGTARGKIALVTADGTAREVADGLAFPNGMAVTPDNGTLVVAESFAARLTAFDIDADGSLSNRRVWADVTGDGICIDAEGAVWCSAVGEGRGKRCSARPRGRRGPRPHRGRPPVLRVYARWRGRQDAVHGRRPVVRSRQDGRAHRGEDRSDRIVMASARSNPFGRPSTDVLFGPTEPSETLGSGHSGVISGWGSEIGTAAAMIRSIRSRSAWLRVFLVCASVAAVGVVASVARGRETTAVGVP
jgi:sugar lactone lactonase YvrE